VRESKMVEKRTIANIVTACIWIGSLIFLIWFCVVQFQRLKHTSVVTTSFSNPEAIQYPGLFICPSTETIQNANGTATPYIYVASGGAIFQPFLPYQQDLTEKTYTVCPRTVNFMSPDGKEVGCIDFQPTPVYNASVTTSTDPDAKFCPMTGNAQAYYFAENANNLPSQPWTATNVGNGLYVGLQSEGIEYQPYMMMFYSGSTRMQPPTSWAAYQQMFSITNFFLAHVPLSTFTAVNVDKLVTDNWPADDNCNYDGFLSAIDVINNYAVTASTFRSSAFLLGFDILEVVTTCHSPVVGGTDVLGIVGGGIALVLFVTLGFQYLVQKLLGVEKQPQESVQSSTYRPLSGE